MAAKKAELESKRLSMRTAAPTTAPATTVSAASVASGEDAARAAYEAKVKANRKW